MKRVVLALLIAAALPAMAQQFTDGEVRKVDKAANKVTLKHGPIPNIDMPAMTMVFKAKDPAMLAGLKAGDKVKFEAQKVGDVYTVTRIEPVK
jgi:Cu(I)/Ag(I) efflux system protein CusF